MERENGKGDEAKKTHRAKGMQDDGVGGDEPEDPSARSRPSYGRIDRGRCRDSDIGDVGEGGDGDDTDVGDVGDGGYRDTAREDDMPSLCCHHHHQPPSRRP